MHHRLAIVIVAVMLLSGCIIGPGMTNVRPTAIDIAAEEFSEQALLDVGIEIFESSPPPETQKDETGLSGEIRSAEARFVPIHLRNTMQRSGHWGAVRVVPVPTFSVDVIVRGTVKRSSSEELMVHIDVHDATGKHWFARTYQDRAAPEDYRKSDGRNDVFQDLYNTIANDLSQYKDSLSPDEGLTIRRIAELRFAESIAPAAFGDYLTTNKRRVYMIKRLPARDDPMLGRVRGIRERDYMLLDTVNYHYDIFYDDMSQSYTAWRSSSMQEQEAMREVRRQERRRYLLGAAAILGAIALEVADVDVDTGSLQNVMLVGGAAAIKSGIDKRAERRIHEDAIRELGESFDAEVTPLMVEVEGETVQLTGSAEAQYTTWRGILNDIYRSETGLVEGRESSAQGVPGVQQ